MREIRSFIGLLPDEFKRLVGNRQLVIWGGNGACIEVLAALRGRYSITTGTVLTLQPAGFQHFPGFAVHHPESWQATHTIDPRTQCVIVASVGYRKQILQRLEAAGFQKHRDFLFAHELFRQKIVIRLGEEAPIHAEGILAFMTRNRNFLRGACIELAGFPDPLACAGLESLLGELVSIAPVTLSTHIPRTELIDLSHRYPLRLRLLIFADASRLQHHFPGCSGGSIEAFCQILRNANATMPIEAVKIGFTPDEQTQFPPGKHIIYANDLSYPVDFSQILRYAEAPTPGVLDALQAGCDFDLAATLAKASAQQDKNCMCERVFPVFNADASLAVCHLHFDGMLNESPLNSSFPEIVEQRRFHNYCQRCQAHGLHRLDVSLL